MRKKTIALALMLALSLSVSACAPGKQSEAESGSSKVESQISQSDDDKFNMSTEAYFFNKETGTWLTVKNGSYEFNSFDIKVIERGKVNEKGELCSESDNKVNVRYVLDGDNISVKVNGKTFDLALLSADSFKKQQKEYMEKVYKEQSSEPDEESDISQSSDEDQSSASASSVVDSFDIESQETVDLIKLRLLQDAVDGSIELKLWCASADVDFEKTLAREFEEKFSQTGAEIKVKVIGVNENSAAFDIIDSPEDGADVFSTYDGYINDLAAGYISPVAEVYSDPVKEAQVESAILPASVYETLCAYPQSVDSGYYLYYDKRVLSEEDIATMDGAIQKSKEVGKSVYYDMCNAWYATGVFFAAGCDISETDGVQTAAFGTSEGLAAAKAICHICENQGDGFEGDPGTLGDDYFIQSGFENGTLSAAVTGAWLAPAIKEAIGEENLGVAKLPTVLIDGEEKQLHSFGGYKLVCVNKCSKYPFSSQTLAYYLTYLNSQLKRYNTLGTIPSDKRLYDEVAATNPIAQAIEAQGPYTHSQAGTICDTYWSCGITEVCGDIVSCKGEISDDELFEKLKQCELNCSSEDSYYE